MSFLEKIRRLATQICERIDHVRGSSEGDARQYLILPFFEAFGYDPFDPTEVQREFSAPVVARGGEKVDFALFVSGKPQIAVETKKLGNKLGDNEIRQLRSYFTFSEAQIGILTNGLEYQFFTDWNKINVMDDRPFFEFDMSSLEEAEFGILEWLTKSKFNKDELVLAGLAYQEKEKTVVSLNPESAEKKRESEVMQVNRIEGAGESPRDQLDRIIKDILRDTVNIALVRTEDSRSMLSVHLDANTLGGKTTRFFRLVKKSDWCSLEFTDTQRSASGGWERGSRKMSRFAKIKDMDDLYNYADTIQERAARFYSPNGRA